MPAPGNSSNQILVTHAVLTGLTPLIPVPLVDDLFYNYFLRSLVQKLAANRGKSLGSNEIGILISQPGRGCALGCLGTIFLYPFKKILRKIFYFLELKRAADTISHTYYVGYLLDVALAEGWLDKPGEENATKIRTAINLVLARTNTSIINRAAFGLVNQSKEILKSLGQLLLSNLPNGKRGEKEVKATVDAVENEEKDKLNSLIDQLQKAIATLPAEHFSQLRQQLAKELGVAVQDSK